MEVICIGIHPRIEVICAFVLLVGMKLICVSVVVLFGMTSICLKIKVIYAVVLLGMNVI